MWQFFYLLKLALELIKLAVIVMVDLNVSFLVQSLPQCNCHEVQSDVQPAEKAFQCSPFIECDWDLDWGLPILGCHCKLMTYCRLRVMYASKCRGFSSKIDWSETFALYNIEYVEIIYSTTCLKLSLLIVNGFSLHNIAVFFKVSGYEFHILNYSYADMRRDEDSNWPFEGFFLLEH